MAGYPPQQHYAAVHQPPSHVTSYPMSGYPLHPPPAIHHPYPPHMSNGPGYPPSYAGGPPPPAPAHASIHSGPSASSTHHQSSGLGTSSQQQRNGVHQGPAPILDRGGPIYETQRGHPPRPIPPAPQAGGPSLSRPPFGQNDSTSQQAMTSNQLGMHHAPSSSSQNMPQHTSNVLASSNQVQHQSQRPYQAPMHPREYDRLPPTQPMPGVGSRGSNQPQATLAPPVPPPAKRPNNNIRDKDRDGIAPSRANATAKAGSNAKRGNQDKNTGGNSGARNAGAIAAEKSANQAAAAAAAADEPIQESKKIRKRKEVVDRIHRVHWDTLENRDIIYNNLQQSLSTISTTLLLCPSHSRTYLMALHRLNLERDDQLRQSALLHAHQVDSARMAYEQEKNKVEEEARTAKKAVREKLLAAVEERRRRLREDKESGEGMSDALLDSSTRPHATRKLRNKGFGASKRDADSDNSLAARVNIPGGGGVNNGVHNANTTSLGLLLSGVNGTGADGTSTPRNGEAVGGYMGYLGSLTSLAEFSHLSGHSGPISSLPPSNFDSAPHNAVSLLALHGVGGGMGDSSYMLGSRVALQNQTKGKKKPGKGVAAAAASANGVVNGAISGLNGGLNGNAADDDEDGNGSNARSAAAAAAAAAASLASVGRLRWDQGKSVGQLTSAKDLEIESDLINIRKSGGKRRRR